MSIRLDAPWTSSHPPLVDREPSSAEHVSHGLLRALGVLQRLPSSWTDTEVIADLPWGPAPTEPPSPHLPPDLDGPWPTESGLHPKLYPRIVRLPVAERRRHREVTVCRYLRQIARTTPCAAMRARTAPRLVALDDERFTTLINETSFSQFVTPLATDDRECFAEILTRMSADVAEDGWFEIDARVLDPADALPGIHVAPTRTLLRFEARTQRFVPVAIHFEGSSPACFGPDDGAAWALARYFVLQALSILLVVVFHPRLHFPGDVINAVTQTLLPPTHPVARLLAPHLDYALALDEAVLHHRRSVLHNSQRELYTPFPMTAAGIHRGVIAGYRGTSTIAPYTWAPNLLDPRTVYGRYRVRWFTTIHRFVDEALAALPADDPLMLRWADSIAPWIPGFPDGAALRCRETRTSAIATYLTQTSVFHTADHHSYGDIPITQVPWRLRVPPPNLRRPTELELDQLVSPEDFFRHSLANEMFFRPTVNTNLRDSAPRFTCPRARQARIRLGAAMADIDVEFARSSFPSSAQIAASIQS